MEKRVSFGIADKARNIVRCDDCGKDIPADEWPNHRDRLRPVHLKARTKTFVQRYVLSPMLSFFIWILVNVFFREVAVVGMHNIPKSGPVVFYGNHQNQFIDAMMMRAFCGRPVRFIIAEKSMSKPIIGQFARLMDAVPVIRPQDVPSISGQGKLVLSDDAVITGQGTNFTTNVKQGDVIIWSSPKKSDRCSGQVLSVPSDTEVILTRSVPPDAAIDSPVNWKLSKRIDHSEMYAEVYETLRNGGAIGIFPEGGSHDHTSLIPLKAGVALFTLGAAERDVQTQIVPVGLTYFYGHRFRSRAHIEFGRPLTAPQECIDQFVTDKRGATGELLKVLDAALRSVTINVRDWSTLKFLHNFRRVYQPPGALARHRRIPCAHASPRCDHGGAHSGLRFPRIQRKSGELQRLLQCSVRARFTGRDAFDSRRLSRATQFFVAVVASAHRNVVRAQLRPHSVLCRMRADWSVVSRAR
jgi:glycerol-3-phosphate O-acyltransferase/dihydroxyacetone phosphate acyltransferase